LPHKFTQYLLSSEVGFRKCEVVSVPPHPSKGFQRPIYLYTKADLAVSPAPTSSATVQTTAAASVEGVPGEVVADMETASVSRNERRHSREQQEFDRREYERELFPTELLKEPWLAPVT
jgi:hypothetical protein